jgi:hypothetical protein
VSKRAHAVQVTTRRKLTSMETPEGTGATTKLETAALAARRATREAESVNDGMIIKGGDCE